MQIETNGQNDLTLPKSQDTFGDRIKAIEAVYAKQTVDLDKPFIVRLDGKAFHTYTKGLKRPYDERLSNAMVQTMNYLIQKTDARLGYTQSDEITLVFFKLNPNQQVYLGGRVQKLTSILSSMASVFFNQMVQNTIPEKSGQLAFFDARVWTVDSLSDVAEVVVWRQEDAIKNAISMAAHSMFSNKELHKKNSAEKLDMIASKGQNWDDYPEFFKSGTFAIRKNVEVDVEITEEKAKYIQAGDKVIRTEIMNFYMPRIRHTKGWSDLLFTPILEEYKKALSFKKERKSKQYQA